MTEDDWKVIGEILDATKERFDEQEKRIKELEWKVEMLIEDKGWIFVQAKDLRNS